MTKHMDWDRVKREERSRRDVTPQRLPPLVRRKVYRDEFGHGSVLEMFEDNEAGTYEAVLTRPGLRVRSGRVPKSMLYDGSAAILRFMGVW